MDEYHILIIEDDPNHLRIIKDLIEDIGSSKIKIFSVDRGLTALQLLKHRYDFDLIIIDIMLHDANGIVLAKYIHNSKMFKRTYVLMLSSSKSNKDISKAKKAGADGYLIKPLNLTEKRKWEFKKIISLIKKGKQKNRGFLVYDIQ